MRVSLPALLCVILLGRAAFALDCAAGFELRAWPGPGDASGELGLSDFRGGEVLLTEKDVAEAAWEMDYSDSPAVTVRFSEEGQAVFARHTTDHVGEPVAIIFDGKLLTAPVIMAPITGGEAMITGQFTPQEAAAMAERLTTKSCPPEAGS